MEILQLLCSHRYCPANISQLNYAQKSKLLYDWRFATNQFILASSPLNLVTRFSFQLNPWCHSPYVTSSLKRRWGCLLWICLARRCQNRAAAPTTDRGYDNVLAGRGLSPNSGRAICYISMQHSHGKTDIFGNKSAPPTLCSIQIPDRQPWHPRW
jgi:hypothetical protein